MEQPPAPPNFSQVVFSDIPHTYPPATSITCTYSLCPALKPHPRDWVGIFKVGWSSAKDYHTFVWAEPSEEGGASVTRQATFKDYYLPRDEVDFYQFCYIDSAGQVRGASTPFSFRGPEEEEEEGEEGAEGAEPQPRPEDDLLVITTQEQVDQSVREKDELQKQLDLMRSENLQLKKNLQEEQEEAVLLKEQNKQMEEEKSGLGSELERIKEENQRLRISAEQLQKRAEEKYDRAVMKINQLKDERRELMEKNQAQGDDVCRLNSKVREGERELLRTTDELQLLQVDHQTLTSELQRLQSAAANMEEVAKENQELRRWLAQPQPQPQPQPGDQDVKVQCQVLAQKLQEAQEVLASEREESRRSRRQVELLEEQLKEHKRQMDNIIGLCEQETRKSNKMEMQLGEAVENLAEKDGAMEEQRDQMMLLRQEQEELRQENQLLKEDMAALRAAYAEDAEDPAHLQPGHAPQAGGGGHAPQAGGGGPPEQEVPQAEEQEEEVLECGHCRESFPGITRAELEQHEQSHRLCPFCSRVCDHMDQSGFEDHVYGHGL